VEIGEVSPPARRRRRGVLIGLVVALVAAAAAVPGLIVLTGDDGPAAAAPSPSPPVSTSPTASALVSPKPGAPADVRFAWARAKITETLAAQSAALRAGDLAAFVAPASDRKVRAELERRFRSLRAMRVTGFELALDSGPFNEKQVKGVSEWGASVAVRHCFAVPRCATESVLVNTVWRDSPGGYRLTKVGTVADDDRGPHPWEVDTLTAAVGERAIVATTKAYAARARAFLPAAERAAKIADKFVLGDRPDRYIIYLAGPKEWKRWFGGVSADWAVGFALPVTENRSDIVLRVEEIDGGFAERVMKHEMGHVATLAGRDYRDINGENWWLTEGIAEYIEWEGRRRDAYDRQAAVRRLVSQATYYGELEKSVPRDDDPDWKVEAYYGVGFYATRCIADHYGEAKLLEFADMVLRGGRPSGAESGPILGIEWDALQKRCLRYTKDAVL